MTKQDYVQIRAGLDFKLRYAWLVGHVLLDLTLLGAPVFWLIGRGGQVHLTLADVGLCLVSALSLAIVFFRSFSMMHEAVHGLLGSNRRANDFAGVIYGALCLLPFDQWREIHLLHHYWSGNVEKDPVRKVTLIFKQEPTLFHRVTSALWPTWFPILSILQFGVFWTECIARFKNKKKSPVALLSVCVPLLLWGGAFAVAGVTVSLMLVVPSILFYLAIVETVNFPHHTDLPQYEGDMKLAVWDQHLTARSCFYPRLLEKFVLLNFNYHIEHHLYPTLPWYRLAALSTILREKIPDYHYSVGNEWILRNRKRPLKEVCLSQSVNTEQKAG